MSTAVLERPAPPETSKPATAQWKKIRDELISRRITVLVAATYDIRDYAGRTHILALTDVRSSRTGRLLIPGLDEEYTPYPAESAFCSTRSNVHLMTFRTWRSRKEETTIGLPNCKRCLRRCQSLTGLPTDQINKAAGRIRRAQLQF